MATARRIRNRNTCLYISRVPLLLDPAFYEVAVRAETPSSVHRASNGWGVTHKYWAGRGGGVVIDKNNHTPSNNQCVGWKCKVTDQWKQCKATDERSNGWQVLRFRHNKITTKTGIFIQTTYSPISRRHIWDLTGGGHNKPFGPAPKPGSTISFLD